MKDSKADEFAKGAAAFLKEFGLGGENFCDAQKEAWLDMARDANKRSVEMAKKRRLNARFSTPPVS